MGILSILVGFFIALLGFPVGFILAKIAKEEIKPGLKYFGLMQKITASLVIISLVYLIFVRNSEALVLFYSMIFIFLLPTAALFSQ